MPVAVERARMATFTARQISLLGQHLRWWVCTSEWEHCEAATKSLTPATNILNSWEGRAAETCAYKSALTRGVVMTAPIKVDDRPTYAWTYVRNYSSPFPSSSNSSCRYLWRHWLGRLSLLRLSPPTPFMMSNPRSKIKKGWFPSDHPIDCQLKKSHCSIPLDQQCLPIHISLLSCYTDPVQ